jgi:putative endonuclease
MIERYFVYLLKSEKDGSIYAGCTSNIEKRLIEHNQGLSRYTASKRPWILEWYCSFFEKTKAFEFEKYLKTSSGKAFSSKRLL